MCKVLIIPSIKDETRDSALKFMKAMSPRMSLHNKDGLGYAAVDSEGKLFGERWHTNADAFGQVVPVPSIEMKALDVFSNISTWSGSAPAWARQKGEYNNFGVVNLDDVSSITLHTRMATSGKEFSNTHPFYDEANDTSLIHNGVIRNTQDFDLKLSTCDSETILISYLEQAVNKLGLKSSIQSMADMIQGYYACGVYSLDDGGNRILDVFKGNNANLFGTYIEELQSVVMSTSQMDIQDTCRELGFTHGMFYEIQSGIALRFNPLTGELLEKVTFSEASEYVSYFKPQQKKKSPTMTLESFRKASHNIRPLKYSGGV